jgi:hypothetical protein
MLGRAAIVVGLALALAGCGPQPAAMPTAAGTPVAMTSECRGGIPQATCEEVQAVALAAVASSGRVPVYVSMARGLFCPDVDCLFEPNRNYPAAVPPDGGTWVASVEIAFAGTDEHAGLHVAQVGSKLVPVLIGYRVPSPGWCPEATCP